MEQFHNRVKSDFTPILFHFKLTGKNNFITLFENIHVLLKVEKKIENTLL